MSIIIRATETATPRWGTEERNKEVTRHKTGQDPSYEPSVFAKQLWFDKYKPVPVVSAQPRVNSVQSQKNKKKQLLLEYNKNIPKVNAKKNNLLENQKVPESERTEKLIKDLKNYNFSGPLLVTAKKNEHQVHINDSDNDSETDKNSSDESIHSGSDSESFDNELISGSDSKTNISKNDADVKSPFNLFNRVNKLIKPEENVSGSREGTPTMNISAVNNTNTKDKNTNTIDFAKIVGFK